jgi:hypothetical protein
MRIAIFTLVTVLLQPAAARGACEAATERPLPLLELYTSEGCSSCPPADRWLRDLERAGRPIAAVPLAFHVGYWDYIGWKDRFAVPAHEARQRARVAGAGERVVYTPQVMLGDDVQVDWRNRATLAAAAAHLEANAPALHLAMRARPTASGYDIDLKSAGEGAWQLHLALYSNGLVSDVTAGENRSVRLQHDRVVRSLHGPWPSGEQRVVPVVLPKERGMSYGVVALIVRPGEAGTGWALDLPLLGCASAPGG